MFAVNRFKQILIVFILIFMYSGLANAAMISGSIYDLALQKESNVIVEIDTVPRQLFVSKSGDYTFSVDSGNYTLYAHSPTGKASESVILRDEGNYTLDIIMEDIIVSPPKDILLKESDINVSSNNIQDSNKNGNMMLVIGLVLVLVLLAIIFYMFIYARKIKLKSSKNIKHGVVEHETEKYAVMHESKNSSQNKSEVQLAQLDEYAHKALQLIKKEKRTTQKELRKEIPLSEAKISLIVTELEDKGKIRKIKKGRGNILIFVKE